LLLSNQSSIKTDKSKPEASAESSYGTEDELPTKTPATGERKKDIKIKVP
jgi:hypothetical protein